MADSYSPVSQDETKNRLAREEKYGGAIDEFDDCRSTQTLSNHGSGDSNSSRDSTALAWFDVSCVVDTTRSDEIYRRTSLKERVLYGAPLKKILSDQSGTVSPGETLTIMGSSGAGKTTLMNILAGRHGNTARAEGRFVSEAKSINSASLGVSRSESSASLENLTQQAPLLGGDSAKSLGSGGGHERVLKMSGKQRCGEGVYGTVLGGGASFQGKGNTIGGVSYVVHEPVLHPQFTVKQHLWFTLSLRLGQNTSRQQKLDMIDKMARDLSLEHLLSAEIGGGAFGPRGLSGGERKLVQIAAESLTDPHLMFLDEPTSSLDASNAMRVIEVLQKLQEARPRVIVYTVHQPRTKIFGEMDKLLLLAFGRTIYYGRASNCLEFFKENGIMCSRDTNPADFLIDSISNEHSALVIAEAFSRSLWKEKLDEEVRQAQLETLVSSSHCCQRLVQNKGKYEQEDSKRYDTSFFMQLGLLLWRSWITFLKDGFPGFFGTLAILSTLSMVVFGILFKNIMEDDSNATSRKVMGFITVLSTLSFIFQARIVYTMGLYQYECTLGTYHYLAFVAKEVIWEAFHSLALIPLALVASVLLFDDLSLFPEIFAIVYLGLILDMLALWFFSMLSGKNLTVGQTMMSFQLTFFFSTSGAIVPIHELPDLWVPFYYISPLQGVYSYMIVVLSGDSDDPKDLALLQKTFGSNGTIPSHYENILLVLAWIVLYLVINTLYVRRITRKNSVNID
eukprot:Nk52_evm7s2596 gene=Nk52_evmTU7s2596